MRHKTLRKHWETDEKIIENQKNNPITANDIGEEELVRIETGLPEFRFYSMIALYNNNKYRTLFDSKMNFKFFYAGTPDAHDCIRYDIITREKADEFYQRPIDHQYTEEEFLKNFKFKSKAKLLQKRSKKNLDFVGRHNKKCYMLNQEIPIGDLGPDSSIFLVMTTLGSNEHFGPQGSFNGNTWDTYENELKEIEKRRRNKKKNGNP